MAELTLSPAAREDIKTIGRYTQKTWGVGQRDRYLGQLAARIEGLLTGTTAIRPRSDLREDLFCAASEHHLIYFRRDAAGNVTVLRVLHERMDSDRYF